MTKTPDPKSVLAVLDGTAVELKLGQQSVGRKWEHWELEVPLQKLLSGFEIETVYNPGGAASARVHVAQGVLYVGLKRLVNKL